MFHAIAFFVYHDKKMHMQVRANVTKQMRKRKKFFMQFFQDKLSFQAHVKNMNRNEVWGSTLELAAVAEGWRDACVVPCVWFLPTLSQSYACVHVLRHACM